MKIKRSYMYLLVVAILWACQDEVTTIPSPGNTNTGSPGTNNGWAISENEVFDGGPGKDGIPSIDDPKFAPTSSINYMADNDLILAINVNGEIRGYTHPVLDWHEIVNDVVGGVELAITYCPLTGTGSAWNRRINNEVTTFGVSGLLYRNNLIPYDRKTDSNWSQIRLDCVQGPLRDTEIETTPMIEMPWRTWKKMFPNEQVLTASTGFNRSYGVYPYGSYRTNHNQLLFPVGDDDDRLPRKERVLGLIVGGDARVYTFGAVSDGVTVRRDQFRGKSVVLIGSKSDNFMIAYHVPDHLSSLQFEGLPIFEGGVIMQDDQGNQWDVFGIARSGPNAGEALEKLDICIGYWFSFGAFYDPEIF